MSTATVDLSLGLVGEGYGGVFEAGDERVAVEGCLAWLVFPGMISSSNVRLEYEVEV